MNLSEYLRTFTRRVRWLSDGLTPEKLWHAGCAAASYALGRETSAAWPLALKIDISPACNLKCPVCVHAEPGDDDLLVRQDFAQKRMSVDHFRTIVEEVRGHVSALSLYYVGDPYAHPEVDEMCRIASDAGLNTHANSNFSFRFTDERIRRIVESGLTHLTVCVDGFSQESYSRTRINGRLDFVLSNLERVCSVRRQLGRCFPRVEVQFIKFPHNVHELEKAIAWFGDVGVDSVEHYWGMVSNYADLEPSRYAVGEPLPRRMLPRCHWPYDSMVIRYDGEVIPCCNFRHATQYVPSEDGRSFGNVFSLGVKAVWDSAIYRQTRRLVADPGAFLGDPVAEGHFCHGCPALFATTQKENIKMAPEFDVAGKRVISLMPVEIRPDP